MIIEVVDGVKTEKKSEILPEIFKRIFAVCKYDDSFSKRDHVNEIDKEIFEIKKKIAKKDDLLRKANEMKRDFNSKIVILDENNMTIRGQLLESLGSEL